MIKQVGDKMEFRFFKIDGDNTYIHPCKDFDDNKRSVFLINFERYVLAASGYDKEGLVVPEARHQAFMRCRNANMYFLDNNVPLQKICSMVLKIQKELNSLLNSKDQGYDTYFKWFNEIIRVSKEEVKRNDDSSSQ